MSPHYNAGSSGAARNTSHPGAGSRRKKNKSTQSNVAPKAAPKAPSQTSTAAPDGGPPRVPLRLSQKVLDVFATAFPDLLDASAADATSTLSTTLQQVKQHLYARDFAAAFGRDAYLAAYAARWSPSRALAYLSVFDETLDRLDLSAAEQEPVRVLSLGGGAGAELLALAAVQYLRSSTSADSECDDQERVQALSLSLTCVDRAAWSPIHDSLLRAATTAPALSQYASAAAKAANHALLSSGDRFTSTCLQIDLLSAEEGSRAVLADQVRESSLITLMFTLNELYTTDLPRAQALLADMTAWTRQKKGVSLLVVDSPGSYSEVGVGPQKKSYPMHWLLDLALLTPTDKGDSESAPWEKLQGQDSQWFRLPATDQLRYPIELENMRFQMHLYRRR